jgi:CO/xanthine dehydrogenase FAD-binding subunit
MGDYLRPNSLADALSALADRRWRIMAGGTDLYPSETGQHLTGPVIDIAALADLHGVREQNEGWRIGAGVTWATLAKTPLPPAFSALQQAAAEVGGRQIQNVGTIGGNLCNASPAADGVPPLLVLGAQVELASAHGHRRLPLADFLQGPRKTALRPGEIMVALHIPASGCRGQSRFLKLGARSYLVISIAMVAARLDVQAGRITDAALSVGACSATACRLGSVESRLIGQPAATAARQIADDMVAAALSPLDDARASAAYRARAAAELLRRAVTQVLA